MKKEAYLLIEAILATSLILTIFTSLIRPQRSKCQDDVLGIAENFLEDTHLEKLRPVQKSVNGYQLALKQRNETEYLFRIKREGAVCYELILSY